MAQELVTAITSAVARIGEILSKGRVWAAQMLNRVRRWLALHRILFVAGMLIFIVGCYWLNRAYVSLGSSAERLETLATAAAALVAVAALFFTLAQQASDRADVRSRFYLEEYRKGYDIAYNILESARANDPRLRLKWIAAARILETARHVAEKVTVEEHRDVLKMDIPRQSQRFQPLFLSRWLPTITVSFRQTIRLIRVKRACTRPRADQRKS